MFIWQKHLCFSITKQTWPSLSDRQHIIFRNISVISYLISRIYLGNYRAFPFVTLFFLPRGEPHVHLILFIALLWSLSQWRSDLFLVSGHWLVSTVRNRTKGSQSQTTYCSWTTEDFLTYSTFRMSGNPQLPFCTPKSRRAGDKKVTLAQVCGCSPWWCSDVMVRMRGTTEVHVSN